MVFYSRTTFRRKTLQEANPIAFHYTERWQKATGSKGHWVGSRFVIDALGGGRMQNRFEGVESQGTLGQRLGLKLMEDKLHKIGRQMFCEPHDHTLRVFSPLER